MSSSVGLAEYFVGAVRSGSDDHLQTRLALRNECFRDFDQFFRRVPRQAEGDIGRQFRVRTAEELPHRLAERFTFDVPERDVDQARCVVPCAHEILTRGAPVELSAHLFGAHCIQAYDDRRGFPVDELADAVFEWIGGKRVPFDTVVGLDFDEIGERVLFLLHQREREGDSQHPTGDPRYRGHRSPFDAICMRRK